MDLQKILADHKLWLGDNSKGVRADLRGDDLRWADLRRADLWGANLQRADLREADLRKANLWRADLQRADLREADLREADLQEAKIFGTCLNLVCPEEGAFIAWKQLANKAIAKLEIPADARRGSATTRKCRADRVKVLTIWDSKGYKVTEGVSLYDPDFVYKVGEIVSVDNFDTNRWDECSYGIHFFVTRQEAMEFEM